jgi:uncharacterized membrane protein (DUF485 family)
MQNPREGTPNLNTRGGQMVLDGERPGFCFHAPLPVLSPAEIQIAPPMSHSPPDDTDFIHSEEFLRGLMRRQLRLSVTCAAAFLLLLLGLPLLNYFAPELMARRVGGFTLSWLVLGVLVFPYVWIIARLFITRSMALEAAEVRLAAERNKRQS